MYSVLKQDQKQIQQILEEVTKQAQIIFSGFDERAAGILLPAIEISDKLNQEGIGAIGALAEFQKNFGDTMSGSAAPNYYGFVTGGSTPAAVAGDWLTSIYDQNVMGSNETLASDFEVATLHMLRSLFRLTDEFEGSFVSGATMSNFTSLAIARQWLGRQLGVNIAEQGVNALADIKLFSATPHSSIYKSLSMLGIGKNALELVPTLENREAINIDELEKALEAYLGPCIVIANAGTVNSVDFDNLVGINKLKKKYKFWLHVDAAFGGFAACSEQYRHLLDGLNNADSITIDAHKWLNVPYDSAMQFSRHLELQTEVFQNSAAYLRQDLSTNNFINITPENSRRFRALPAWFTLKAYGSSGYEEMVNRACEVAAWIADKMEQHQYFDLLSPQKLNGVCFTVIKNGQYLQQEEINQAILILQRSGDIYLTPTVYKGNPALRFSVSNWSTEITHAHKAWLALESMSNVLQS